MATFYIDPDSGNDASAGTSFAAAWQTITLGATAARIAPGDTIRIKASPLPTNTGVTGTWTSLSKDLTLSAALTKTIENCEAAWTGLVNVTATTTTTRRQGSNAASLAIAAGFTTGPVAFFDPGSSQDFSSYEQVSLWFRSNVANIASGVFELQLCSDALGVVVVDTLTIPATAGANAWNAVVINKGSALGSSIRSVTLNAVSDPGTVTVILDNIIACKAAANAGSITHRSLIGKGTGTEAAQWYPIQSIDGTAIEISMGIDSTPAANRGIYITSEAVALYKREAFLTTPVNAAGTVVAATTDAGTATSPIAYSGGWNRTDMSTQNSGEDGFSWFTGQNGLGIGFNWPQNYNTVERLGLAYYTQGFVMTAKKPILTNGRGSGLAASALMVSNGTNGALIDTYIGLSGSNRHLNVAAGADVVMLDSKIQGTQLFDPGNLSGMGEFIRCDFRNGATYSFTVSNGLGWMRGCNFSSSTTGGIQLLTGKLYLENCTIAEATEVGVTTIPERFSYVYSNRHDDTADLHKIFGPLGSVISIADSNRHTLTDIAWKMSPLLAEMDANLALEIEIARIAVLSGTLVTVKAWMKRSNTALTGRLICKGGQIAGVATDVTASVSAGADTYEELTITFTPSAAGVVAILAQAYGGTSHSLYIDDMTISQA